MLLFRSCDLSVPAQHTWTCKLAGACLLATCPYYVVPIPKVYVYVLFLLLRSQGDRFGRQHPNDSVSFELRVEEACDSFEAT